MQTIVKELLYEVGGDGIAIALALNAEGSAERLDYRSGEQTLEFSGEEIEIARSDEGTRASVLLESGAADGPIVRLTLIVPDVVFGEESSVDVTAAAVRTTQRSLFGGERPGPQQSYEALALTGTAAGASDGEVGTCHGWKATMDLRPPTRKLVVTGTCTFGSPGYSVELRRHEPPGINPRDLLLDKIVVEPTGPAAQVITEVEVRYEEFTAAELDTVTILPDGPSIPVVEAH